MVKSNIDALRSVYLSLGGSLDDTYEDINGGSPVSAYRSVKDHIAAISKLDIGSSGGGSSGGGGNGLFVVNITSVGETFTSDKTISEILQAISENKNVVAWYTAPNRKVVYPLTDIYNKGQVVFTLLNVDSYNGVYSSGFNISKNGVIAINEKYPNNNQS